MERAKELTNNQKKASNLSVQTVQNTIKNLILRVISGLKQNSFSYREIGKVLGLSGGQVSDIEKGKWYPGEKGEMQIYAKIVGGSIWPKQ